MFALLKKQSDGSYKPGKVRWDTMLEAFEYLSTKITAKQRSKYKIQRSA